MPNRSEDRQSPCRVLLLGGTGEAAALARAVTTRFGPLVALTTSLAGRTARPVPVPGDVRIGGFGGADGLAAYLRARAIEMVIDATHPFADQISAHARLACEAAGVHRLMLLRPPWQRHPLDRWIEVGAFADVVDVRFLVRLIHEPPSRLPLRFHEVVLGRGPFTIAEETHLLQRHAIDVLVCKASGGRATEAKLIAAREASLPVIMVRRPPAEPGVAVETVEAALSWLGERLREAPPSTSERSLP
jgi:precorrin-6A/cobalt-precorrin-6A reductase